MADVRRVEGPTEQCDFHVLSSLGRIPGKAVRVEHLLVSVKVPLLLDERSKLGFKAFGQLRQRATFLDPDPPPVRPAQQIECRNVVHELVGVAAPCEIAPAKLESGANNRHPGKQGTKGVAIRYMEHRTRAALSGKLVKGWS